MSGRRISQNVDASESFVDGRNSGFLETIGAYQSGCMIYGRLDIWETPTKGEDGSGTNRCPGIEPQPTRTRRAMPRGPVASSWPSMSSCGALGRRLRDSRSPKFRIRPGRADPPYL